MRLVEMVLESFGLMHLRGGEVNPRVKCYRLLSDSMPMFHRPLWMYIGSSVLCPLMTQQVMWALGFRRGKVGGLVYWKRGPRRDVAPEDDVTGQMPLVFVHGLGVGLVPYYLFVYRLSKRHRGDFFVPEFPFMAMAPWETVPSAREVVAQLQDMLTANEHTAAHFVGHSFGAVVLTWVLKMSPSSIRQATFMDPANFLIMKSEALVRVLYGEPRSVYEVIIQFFGFRELFTLNLLCRNCFWEQSLLWPENIHVPCVVELAGDDHIISSLFVRRLLQHEVEARKGARKLVARSSNGQNRGRRGTSAVVTVGSAADLKSALMASNSKCTEDLDIMWCDHFLHGEILVRVGSQDKLFSKMKQLRLKIESK